jgi:hypothetical protein
MPNHFIDRFFFVAQVLYPLLRWITSLKEKAEGGF